MIPALSEALTLASWTRMVHGLRLVLSISIHTLELGAHQNSRVSRFVCMLAKPDQLVYCPAGADDTNSYKAPILPWLRSLDGLNTHDDGYGLARSGGVTTAQILPGSANDIGVFQRHLFFRVVHVIFARWTGVCH